MSRVTALACTLLLAGSALIRGEEGPVAPAGVVSHVKVLSDRVEDVSSAEAWRRSVLEGVDSEEARGLMIWRSVVKFVLNGFPALEYIQNKEIVVDPVKIMNVYGQSFCGPHAATMIALARHSGMKARGWGLNGHVVPELWWDGDWHMLDSSLVSYFPEENGSPASVMEILQEVSDWYRENPGYVGDPEGLLRIQQSENHRGWTRGPAVLARSPFLSEGGWYPARTHGWAATMQEYDGSYHSEGYEMAYSMGYKVNNQLRPGQTLTFNWSNKGLHINMNEPRYRNDPELVMGTGVARHTPSFGDLASGRIGNGTLDWELPLEMGALRAAALAVSGFREAGTRNSSRSLAVTSGSEPGILELRIPSSYVYLTGTLSLRTESEGAHHVEVLFSQNHGIDWERVALLEEPGDHLISMTQKVFRRYDYRLRILARGAGTALKRVRILHDIQHSQRALPALGEGVNDISFSSGPDEGTITMEGSLDGERGDRQLLWTDYHPRLVGFRRGIVWDVEGRRGAVQVPVETPGEMARIRVSLSARVRNENDLLAVSVSYDGGTSFLGLGECRGPRPSTTCQFTSPPSPSGTRHAILRIEGHRQNVVRIFNLRVDADYREPHGGFQPVEIAYSWTEGGQPRRHLHVARAPEESYRIIAGRELKMKSLVLRQSVDAGP